MIFHLRDINIADIMQRNINGIGVNSKIISEIKNFENGWEGDEIRYGDEIILQSTLTGIRSSPMRILKIIDKSLTVLNLKPLNNVQQDGSIVLKDDKKEINESVLQMHKICLITVEENEKESMKWIGCHDDKVITYESNSPLFSLTNDEQYDKVIDISEAAVWTIAGTGKNLSCKFFMRIIESRKRY